MRKIKLLILCAIILCALLLANACGMGAIRVKSGTKIDGIDISSLTEAEAKAKLSEHYNTMLKESIITIQADRTHRYSAQELGFYVDFSNALNSALNQGRFTRSHEYASEIVLNHDAAREKLESIANRVNAEPKAPSAEYINGEIVFTGGENGKRLDISNILEQLEAAKGSVLKSGATIQARLDEITYSAGVDIENLKANYTLLGEFKTSFSESPLNGENRVKNIIKAAQMIDGAVIKPDEEFNTNEILGDRNKENGWYKAPAIWNGKYRLEYGGGVCQVSSTLYNAVLLANLEVVERRPHSWPMSYVPIGRDATISTGGANFRFRNSTSSDIIIGAIVDKRAETITVRIFGKHEGNYARVEILSKEVDTIEAPEPEYIEDTTLSAGEQRVERKERTGRKSVTIRIFYDESGKEIARETVSEDTYRAIRARIRVGV